MEGVARWSREEGVVRILLRRTGLAKKWTGTKKIMKNPPKKDEATVALLKMTKQPTKHLLNKITGVPSNKKNKGIGSCGS